MCRVRWPAMADRGPGAIPYYFRALAMGIPALMLGLQIATWAGFAHIIRDGHADFRTFCTAGYMVRTGRSSQLFDYDAVKATQDAIVSPAEISLPYIHPAYEAALFAPFSFLGYLNAYCTYLAIDLALVFVAVWLLLPRLEGLRSLGAGMPYWFAICFVPTGVALMQGQDSVLLLLVLAGTAMLLDRRYDWKAGLVLGLGAFRFQIVAPIALLFFLWRCWKLVLGFAASGGVLALVSVWMTGIRGARQNVSMLLAMSSGVDPLYQRPIGVMPNLRGFLYGVAHIWLSLPAIRIASLVMSLVVLVFVGLLKPRNWQFRIAIVAAALTSFHLLVHDLTILLVPVLLTISESFSAFERSSSGTQFRLWSAFAVFSSPLLLLFGINYFFLAALPIAILLAALILDARAAAPDKELVASPI